MKVIVSIIVPCYNQAQYLDEALHSVLQQTFTSWECIVVNDGSPDNTDEVAKKWLEKDSRFKYIYQENKGVSGARNFGIANAFGEFILPLDADDYLSTNYIEECLKIIKNTNIKVVYGKAHFFGEQEGELSLGKATIQNMLKNNRIHCAGLYRKIDWELNNGYDESMKHGIEDWEFWINMLKKGGDAVLAEECVLYYRIKPLSRSTEINSNLKKNDQMLDYLYKKHIDCLIYNYNYMEQTNLKLLTENILLKVNLKSEKVLINELCFKIFGFRLFNLKNK